MEFNKWNIVKKNKRKFILPFIFWIIAIFITIFLYHSYNQTLKANLLDQKNNQMQEQKKLFDEFANDYINTISKDVDFYLKYLSIIKTFVETSSNVTQPISICDSETYGQVCNNFNKFVSRKQFSEMCLNIVGNHDNIIRSFAWIPHVYDDDRELYESMVSYEYDTDLVIKEPSGFNHVFIPSSKKDEYYPIYYIEPYETNTVMLMFDMATGSYGNRLTSRKETKQFASSKIQIGPQAGIAVTEPVTIKNNIIGYVSFAFFIGDMIMESVKSLVKENLYIQITDKTDNDNYLHGTRFENNEWTHESTDLGKPETLFSLSRTIYVADREWTINVKDMPNFVNHGTNHMSFMKNSSDTYKNLSIFVIILILISSLSLGFAYIIFQALTNQYKKLERLLERETKSMEDLQIAVEKEKIHSNEKDNFLKFACHELLNAINGANGAINEMKDTHLNDDQTSLIDDISACIGRQHRLFSDLQMLLKMDKNSFELDVSNFNIKEQLDFIVNTNRRRIETDNENTTKIHLIYDDELNSKIYIGDSIRFVQILENFVSNSVKNTPDGFIKIHANIKKKIKDYYFVKFCIEDTGLGISQKNLDQLWIPYAVRARKGIDGTGLGLPICKKLVEMMGGEIEVDSVIGRGTKFWFTLKFRINIATKNTRILRNLEYKIKKENLHILITDDNDLNRKMLNRRFPKTCRDTFKYDGEIIIDEADDGSIALEKMKNNKYDLVFMDIHMNDMDGDEAVRKYREFEKENRNYKTNIVALSASTGNSQKYLDIMTDYIPKPINNEKIINVIIDYIC